MIEQTKRRPAPDVLGLVGQIAARARVADVAVFGVLLLALVGALHWQVFFDTDGGFYRAFDWPKEYAYYGVLREMVQTGQLPYHVDAPLQRVNDNEFTDRFLAVPETLLSPQIVLLPWLDTKSFVFVNTLLLYLIGLGGCLLIRRKYGLSWPVFLILYAVFSFNGHITAHLSQGHSMWNGYFLLPFVILLVLAAVERPLVPADALKLALVLGAIGLQGAFHMLVWCVVFVLLLCWSVPRNAPLLLGAVTLAGALLAFRLLPAATTFEGMRFISGYPSLWLLAEALVAIRDWRGQAIATLGYWEYDLYIGVVAALFIGYFGVYVRWLRGDLYQGLAYRALDLPVVALSVLGYNNIYALLTAYVELPGLSSQRVTSRFLILPLLILTVLACIRAQRWLERNHERANQLRLAAVGAVTLMLLWAHTRVWRMSEIEHDFATRLSDQLTALRVPPLVVRPDERYIAALHTGALISSLALLVLVGGMLLAFGKPRLDLVSLRASIAKTWHQKAKSEGQ
jgi:hypothetical protein